MAESKMELEDWLDDLCVRFIINLPAEDLSSVARICFQVEEAQWFYEDFIRPLDPTLPSMTLRGFCLKIFQHCPLLASFPVENHMRAFEEFLQYKTRVPVRGAIMLNEAMDSTVLVKGWKKGANWSFPRGKINKDEDDLDCAIREVYEETGFDIKAAGLVPRDDQVKYIEINMREQQLRLYVFRNVPMDTHFEPKTRKEISKIEWYKLSELPAFRKRGANHRDDIAAANNANKFYMVAPFLVPLKKWVVQQKKRDGRLQPSVPGLATQPIHEEPLTEDDAALGSAFPLSATVPAIDAFEGATRELQRRLNVQPPTQEDLLQTSPADSTAAADPGQAKGNALLALLQSGTRSSTSPATDTHVNPLGPITAHFASPGLVPGSGHVASSTGHHYTQPPPYQGAPPASFQLGPGVGGTPSHPPALYGGAPNPGGRQDQALPPPGSYVPVPYQQPGMSLNASSLLRQLQNPVAQNERPAYHGPPLGPEIHHNQAQAGFPQNTSPTQPDPHRRQPLPQLNNHAMSLLSAFTTNSARGPDPGHANPPVPEQARDVIKPSGVAPIGNSAMPGEPSGPASFQPPNQTQPFSDQHRNALLDAFKSQSQAPPTKDVPSHNASSTSGASEPAGINHGRVQADLGVNLPFGALKLLSRPEGLRGDAPVAPIAMPASTAAAQAPGIIEPTNPNARQSPVPLPSTNAPGQPPTAGRVSAPRAARSPIPQRLDAIAGQKNLLLSLFARAQTPSQATSSAVGGAKGKETAESQPTPEIAPRAASIVHPGSGVARYALPSVEPISRLGAQTPMSTADRSFLLGYLQSVTTNRPGQ
ncbi:mRNA-decapping enzyme 2 [Gaeumannomyces tritici R3-111a-1]|uniref:mRNA-decapping enzyme 2 n=1 Tax=Gaeumannomyces tritici (strain R3-111a-1) TaxID=644352 RepID=J3P3Y4_GAET3|nr:mRNA-decapping enzyme 2 [Gaeumannomyces tritici R3-111a-1]EJT74378.1 mRNA-decapping enzyme 2 [Gaeumannomyces tritici R3-111a-1]